MQPRGAVVHRPQLKPMCAFCHPRGMLKHPAIHGHKIVAAHSAGSFKALVGMGFGPVVSNIFAGGKPDACMAIGIIYKALQGCGPAWPANEPAM